MYGLSALHLAWALMGLYLIIGLIIYERTGMRLGGVLVLPLLLLYALIDLRTLLVFALASGATFLVGWILISQTLAYGRRALYLFLLIGLIATALVNDLMGSPLTAMMLALLPGLYAYNLHREGTQVKGVASFMIAFALLLALTLVAFWAAHNDIATVAWIRDLPLDGALSVSLVAVASAEEMLDGGVE